MTVEFEAWYHANLGAGVYEIFVGQRFKAGATNVALGAAAAPSTPALRFASHGPRVAIADHLVVSRFPPDGHAGHEAGVLPHIVLADHTLPWLRDKPNGAPWFALIVLAGDEIDAVSRATRSAADLGLDDEPGQPADETGVELTMTAALAKRILPSGAETTLLAHTRRRTDNASVATTSVVVSNRLTVPGVVNQVHLISLEKLDLDALPSSGDVTLLSLTSWQFESNDQGPTFRDLAAALAHNAGPLRHTTGDADIDPYLARGGVPVRHGNDLSLYRGPLVPMGHDPIRQSFGDHLEESLPTHSMAYRIVDRDLGLADDSYAVAFSLGRELLLAEHSVALELDAFRRAERRRSHVQGALHGLADHRQQATDPSPTLVNWFRQTGQLTTVPARYLLPDVERLLPATEAEWTEEGNIHRAAGRIAFFEVDPLWVAVLVYGALTTGAHTKAERSSSTHAGQDDQQGFLLRSALLHWEDLVITAWPGRIDAPDTDRPIELRRRDLAPDIALFLFDKQGGPVTVEIGRQPHGLHFGIEDPSGTPHKFPRDDAGRPQSKSIPVPTRSGDPTVLDIAQLAGDLGVTESASFARHMVAGSPRIRFSFEAGGRG